MKPVYWLTIIIVLASVLRLYNLANNPPATYGDEISFAWNAWSILKTGTDQYGTPFPLQFRAFEDYKAPIPVYLLTPLFAIFGMHTFILRLPVALAGVATVWVTYALVKKLFQNSKTSEMTERIALLSAFLLAISPWHIHLSRGYFEATLALLPFLLGIYFFLKGLEQEKYFYVSSLAFAVSLYTYFTPRIILPIFLPFLYWYFRKQLPKNKRTFVLSIVLLVVLTMPLVKLSLFDHGGNRMEYLIQSRMQKSAEEATTQLAHANEPLVLKKLLHNRYEIFLAKIGNDYLEHFSFNYWYIYGDNSLRYFLGTRGMFYRIELPFLLIGLFSLFLRNRRISLFLVVYLLIMPIPTALVGKSFAVRSLAMLPIPFIFVSYGMLTVFTLVKKYRWRRLLLALVVVGFSASLLNYIIRYHLDYVSYGATWWGWENKAAIDYARARENQYDQIFISNFYSGVDLAYAYYTRFDPLTYREAVNHPVVVADNRHEIKLGKYYFGSLDLDAQRLQMHVIPPRTLYIGRPEEPDGQASITAPDDGRILFKIHTTQ